jgi:hypothetical protein
MRQIVLGVVCLAVLSFGLAGSAAAQPQGNDQQKCINKINKGTSKVHAAQGKANAGCIKDAVLKGTPAEPCILDDPKDKVEGKQAKLNEDDMKNCTDTPDFGYTSGAFAGTTAYQAEVNLIHDVYGNPVDTGLYLCDTNPAECLCQRQVDGRIEKLFRSMSKLFLKCKKPALAIGKDPFPTGADDAGDLADCIDDGGVALSVQSDGKGKLADGTQQLQDTAGQFCYTTPNDEFGNGACSGFHGNPAGLATCLRNQVECRFCQMYKAVDGLGANINCATWSGEAGCTP